MNNNDFVIENKFITNQPKPKKNKTLVILLILLLLGVLGYFGYTYFFNKKSDDNKDNKAGYNLGDVPSNETSNSISNQVSNSNSNQVSNIISNETSNVLSNETSNNTSNDVDSNNNKQSNETSNNKQSNSNKSSNNTTSNSNIQSNANRPSNVNKPSNVNTTVRVTGITLNKTSISLTKGSAATISATVSPSNATNKNVSWTSSNENVATVNSSGKITATGVGTTTIIASTVDGNKQAKVTVKVTLAPVSKITMSTSSDKIYVGKTLTAKITYTPSDAEGRSVTWTSSNTKVATVDKNGVIKGITSGTVKITAATPNGKSVTKTFTVTYDPSDYSVVMTPQYAYAGGKDPNNTFLVGYNLTVQKNNSLTTNFINVKYNGNNYVAQFIENSNIDKNIKTAIVNINENGKTVAISGVKVVYKD